MLKVPVAALRLSVTFIVEVPLPAMEDGLKLMLVPFFWPDADSEIEEILPKVTVVVMVEVAEPPFAIESDVGFAVIVKLDGTVVTVRLMVVDCTVPSLPVPVTVTVAVPILAVVLAVKVNTELPEGPMGLVA